MLKTLVKISNINNLSDARYCAGMGVELLGFQMKESSLEKYKEMRGWLAGVKIVGETDSESLLEIMDLKEKFQPDYLQVSSANNLQEITRMGLPIILKVDFSLENIDAFLQKNAAWVEYFLVENSDDFARLDDESLAKIDHLAFKHPIILGFGITENNANENIKNLKISGIALNGGHEDKPGQNEYAELMDILEVLEED